MGDLLSIRGEQVLFGTAVPQAVNVHLQAAVVAYEDTDRAEGLLWEALRTEPTQLETYVALYKFYFYKFRLDEARVVASMALTMAASVGGFEADWQALDAHAADWNRHDGPERFYLYALKALGFIRLRQGDADEGARILDKLNELDPLDQVGWSVISDLAEGLKDDD